MATTTGRDELEMEWAGLLANLESYNRQTTFQTVSNSLDPPERTQSIQSAREGAQAHQQSARIDLIHTSKAQAATDKHKAKYVEKHTRPDGSLLPSAFANDFGPRPTRQRRVKKTGYTRVSPWARQAVETRRLLSQRRSHETNGPPTDIQQPRSYHSDMMNAVVRERLGVVVAHWTSPVQHLSGVVSPTGESRQAGLAGDASPATLSPRGASGLTGPWGIQEDVGMAANISVEPRPQWSHTRAATRQSQGREMPMNSSMTDSSRTSSAIDNEDEEDMVGEPRLLDEVYYADRPLTLCTVVEETRAINELVWRLFDIPIFGWTPRYPVMSAVPRPGQFQQGPGEVYVSREVSYYGSKRETPDETDLAESEVTNSPNGAYMSRLRLTRSEPLHDWPRRSAIDDYYEEDSDDDDETTAPRQHRERRQVPRRGTGF
ncbi:hypothetical protein RBB50_000430 [Rhinocladiella similis]